jgi:hypothetical protein
MTGKTDKPLSKEQDDLKRRAEAFLDEIKARGGFKRLYSAEHTNEIARQQGIELGYFYKLLNCMPKGSGLYRKPALLSAVLKDTAYPAELLFMDTADPPAPVTLNKLGPGVAREIQEIVANAFQQIAKKPPRQVGLRRMISTAFSILSIAKLLQQKNDYQLAFQYLFYSFSSQDLKSFPHSRTKDIEAVDKLCKHCIRYNSEDGGSLLTLSYLLYAIYKIGNSLIWVTERSKTLPPAKIPMINGIDFKDNLSSSAFRSYLHTIPELFNEITRKYLEGKYKEVTDTDEYVINCYRYPPLSNTTISQCIKYAQECLEKMITFNITIGTESLSGPNFEDYGFDTIVGLDPKITPRFTVKFDASLLDDFKLLDENLKNFIFDYPTQQPS